MTLGQTPLYNPDIVLYTDGSASLDPASAGWGVFISIPQDSSASLWGPVITDCTDSDWIGALRLTNNTGEISSIYNALQWVRGGDGPFSTVARRRINLLTDSGYCVRLFGDNSIKPRCNKALIQRVRCILTVVRRHYDLAISWVKAQTGLAAAELVGNATQTASPPVAEQTPPVRRCTPLRPPLDPSEDALLVDPRESCAPPILPFTSPSQIKIWLRVARVCRDISPAPAVTIPARSGHIVGK